MLEDSQTHDVAKHLTGSPNENELQNGRRLILKYFSPTCGLVGLGFDLAMQ